LLGADGNEKPTDQIVTVWVFQSGGTAFEGGPFNPEDYTLDGFPTAILAGTTSAQFPFYVTNGHVAGLDKTAVLTLGQAYTPEGIFTPSYPIAVNAIIKGTTKDVVTIVNTNLPQVSFVTTSGSGVTGTAGGSIPLSIQLSAQTSKTATVVVNPFDGTAYYGTDYYMPTLVQFAPGQTLWNGSITLAKTNAYYSSKTLTLTLQLPTNSTLGSSATFYGSITNSNTPPKVSVPNYVTQKKPSAATPGNLAFYTGGPVNVAAPKPGPVIVSGGGAPTTKAGQIMILTSHGGAISGGTAFFDANMNGLLDPGEPFTTTEADGYFALTIPTSFDLNNNGTIDPGEGQIVVVGGTDMATLLPQAGPLVAVPGSFVLSPLTTLMACLVSSQGFGLTDAEQQVIQAFTLPAVDLTTFDPTQEMLNGDANAIGVYAGIAKLEDTISQITAVVAATPGALPASAVGNNVITSMACAIAAPGATLDLNDSTALGTIIQSTLDSSGAALDPSIVAAAANIIAFGNQQIDAISPSIDATYMKSVVQVQVIAQGTTANQLADLAAGNTDITTVTQNNTGTVFQNLAASAQTGDVVPPVLAIYDVSHVNSSTGQTAYDFTVGLSVSSVLPVSVDYSTYDGSATAANGDYVPTSGTLTWTPGDTSLRTIRVWVNPNTAFRPDEQFAVILSNAVNATTRRPVGTGVIVDQIPLNYVAPANSGDNNLDLQVDGNNLLLTCNGQAIFNGPLSPSSPITIAGAAGVKNSLTVELVNNSTLPSAGLVFQGGSLGTDTLSILDASAGSAVQSPTGPGSGTFTIDGVTVQYSNLASATDQLTTFRYGSQIGLISSVNPSLWNQPVTLTAGVLVPIPAAPAPTGSITFMDSTTGQALGTVPISNGIAALAPVTLSVGTHNIAALYSGDSYYNSNSAVMMQTVYQDPTTATIKTSASSSIPGQAVTITVSVSATAPGSGVPTGNVDIRDTISGIDLGTVTLVNGSATLTTSALPVGSYNLQATYSGDTNFLSTNSAVTQSVTQSAYVLDATAGGALTVSGSGIIKLPGNLIVDSNSNTALTESGNAKITAASIQVVGGVSKSGNATLSPSATTGNTAVGDPLGTLLGPSTTGLTYYGSVSYSGKGTYTLQPGIYSQISASGNASLVLSQGLYIIEGGGLTVTGNASISSTGTGVTIYNTGSNYPAAGGSYGGITLSGNGTFSLTAATGGSYPGIVIYQSRSSTRALSFSGNGATGVTGTVYAPTAQVTVSGNAQLNGALIADRLSVSGNGVSTQVADGSAGSIIDTAGAGTLLAGNLNVYVNDPTGYFTADELNRIQDAINTWDGLLAPYNVQISEVSDPTLANVVIDDGATSAAGSASDGILGCYNSTGEITILQGWNWYGGSDPTQIGSDQYDFQTVVTHELGHALGLGGSSDSTSPMFELLAAGVVRRTPTAADLNIPETPDGADPERAAPVAPLGSSLLSLPDISFAMTDIATGTSVGQKPAPLIRLSVSESIVTENFAPIVAAFVSNTRDSTSLADAASLSISQRDLSLPGSSAVLADRMVLREREGTHMQPVAVPKSDRAVAAARVLRESLRSEVQINTGNESLWQDRGEAWLSELGISAPATANVRRETVQITDAIFAAMALAGITAMPAELLGKERRRHLEMIPDRHPR
jgi:hypothetical protein